MESVLRAGAVYIILLALFRIAGKRSLAQITTFDFILLLIVSEAIQNAMAAKDHSFTNALLVVMTLVGIDIGLSLLKQRSQTIERFVDGVPMLLCEDGRLLEDRMKRERVDVHDIRAAAREHHGLERMDQIKYAVLERDGAISIVPRER